MDMPAPAVFKLTHLLFLAAGCGLLFLLVRLYQRSEKRILRFGISTFCGSLIGVMAAYLLSHVILIFLRAGGGAQVEPGFVFWSIFVAAALIFIISGGLIGLIVGRKKDEQEDGE